MGQPSTNPVISAATKRWVLIVATFGQFMGPFDGSVVNFAIPSIGKSLGGSISSLSWIITSYLILLATLSLTAGRLADIHGRKNTYAIGVGIFVTASAMCSLAPSVNALIGTRLFQGIGASMMGGNSIALLSSFYAPGERGKAIGVLSASTFTGLSLAPSAGGFLIQYLGWRSIFYVNVPIGIVVILITLFLIRGEIPTGKPEKFDPKGAVLWGVAISLVLFGVSTLSSYLGIAITTLAGGISIMAVFVLVESKTEHPLLDLNLLKKNRLFTLSVSTAFLNYASTYGIVFVMSLYLRLGLGLSPFNAGLVWLTEPLVVIVTSPIGGYISDRVEPRYQTTAALSVICASMLSLSTLGTHSTPLEIIPRLAFLGVGSGFFGSANTNTVMSTVNKYQYGVASGIQNTMRTSGQAISLALVVALLTEVFHQNASLSTALVSVPSNVIVDGVRIALITLAVINAAGILTSVNRGKRNREPAASQPIEKVASA